MMKASSNIDVESSSDEASTSGVGSTTGTSTISGSGFAKPTPKISACCLANSAACLRGSETNALPTRACTG